MNNLSGNIVTTIAQNCKRCYSCIRECPAKAIKVENGQAIVMGERCIGCGHCVKVCSQNAKQIRTDIPKVEYFLQNYRTFALLAPSFAVTFNGSSEKIPGIIKAIGFEKVMETAFGADLISFEYEKLFEQNGNKPIISSPCPAINNYIEKYFPELLPNLAPIVSPMIAMGRYIKSTYGNDVKVVFMGPCVAKKSEYEDASIDSVVDAVLTFTELRELINSFGIDQNKIKKTNFDPPHSLNGKSFPLAGGLLKTSNIPSDVLAKEVIVVEGKEKVKQILEEIRNNKIRAKLVDILFCEGCISGPAIESNLDYYSKRERMIDYVTENLSAVDKNVWKSDIFNSRSINLKREFTNRDTRRPTPSDEQLKEILAKTGKYSKQDELNCGACGYTSCREYAIAIGKGLAEEEMCLPYLINTLENAYKDLKNTQEQLQAAEKLASIGQLAAGIAHEINNPLGTILLYSSMLKRVNEKAGNQEQVVEDLSLIIDETNRCKNIVSDLLNFARQGKLILNEFNIFDLVLKIVNTKCLHSSCCRVDIKLSRKAPDIIIEGDPDQLKQVFINIIGNACEALEDTQQPKINIDFRNENEKVIIEISDNGCGIPEGNIGKLFTPFFTTKKMGKGTGLGLAITYGIIKMHRGEIYVESKINEGTKFTIKLPLKLSNFN